MPVRFKGEELIPAPFVSIQREFQKKADIIFSEYTYTLTGTIVNVGTSKDSPGAQSYGSSMEDILAEQKRIRNLFNEDSFGSRLEIETPDGGGPDTIDAYCDVISVGFGEGTWVDRCRYTITLKSKRIESDDDQNNSAIQDYNEDWSINENDDKSWSLSRKMDARGALIYISAGTSNNPIEDAKAFIRARKYSIDVNGTLNHPGVENFSPSGFLAGINNTNNFWNYQTSETVDPTSYTYSLTENFIYYPSGNAKDLWSINYSINQDNIEKADVSIDGTILGYSDKVSSYELRSANAKSYFENTVSSSLYSRISSYAPSGYTLNTDPLSRQISLDYGTGQLRYNFSYIAFRNKLISNSIDETISVADTGYQDVFASIPVPGRANGPIIQNMNTVQLPSRTVSINATIASSGTLTLANLTSMYLTKPNTNTIIDALKPSAGTYYITSDNEDWNINRRQYSRSTSWQLVPEGATISGLPVGIHNLG